MTEHLSICMFCGTEHPSTATVCPNCGRAHIDERLTAEEPIQLGFATEPAPSAEEPRRDVAAAGERSSDTTPPVEATVDAPPVDTEDQQPETATASASMVQQAPDVEAPVQVTPHEIETPPDEAPVELTPHEIEPTPDRIVPEPAPTPVAPSSEGPSTPLTEVAAGGPPPHEAGDELTNTDEFDLADRPGPGVAPSTAAVSAADDALLDAMTAWPEKDLDWMTPEQREELARSSPSDTAADATWLIASPATPPIERATPEPAPPADDDDQDAPSGDFMPAATSESPEIPPAAEIPVEPFEPDTLPPTDPSPSDTSGSDTQQDDVAPSGVAANVADPDQAPAVPAAPPAFEATRVAPQSAEPPSRTPVAPQTGSRRSQTLVVALVVLGVIAGWFIILSLISRDSGDPVDIAGSDVVVSTTESGTTLASTAAPTTTGPEDEGTDDGANATTAAPTTTATTLPPVPDIPAVGDPIPVADLGLGGFALGDLDFGSTDALGRLVATFGAPDAYEPMQGAFGLCDDVAGFTTTWGPLTGVFSGTVEASVFEAYRVASGGGDHPAAGLTTLSGLAPGDTVADLKSVYSGFIVTLEEGDGGSRFILTRGSDGRTLLWGPVSDTSDEGTVLGIYAPDACDGGPVPGP